MIKNVFTDYQTSLVEDNIRLAYFIALKWQKRLCFSIEIDELNSLCLFGLTKAAKTFSEDRNVKFSSYSIKCMENEILMTVRRPKCRVSTIAVSKLVTEDEESIFNMWDFIQAKVVKSDNVEDWFNVYALSEIINELPPLLKEIINLYITGKKQNQIGKILGLSQSYICRLASKGRKQILKEYDYSEYGIKFRRVRMRENICHKCKYETTSGGKLPCSKCSKIIGNDGVENFELKEKKDA